MTSNVFALRMMVVVVLSIYDLLNDDFSAVYDVDTLLWLTKTLAVEVVKQAVSFWLLAISYFMDARSATADCHTEALGEGGLAIIDSDGIAQNGG